MLVYAAAIPPLPVRQQLLSVVRSADLTGRQFDPVAAGDMHLPIAGFGNLPQGEVRRLVAELRRESTGWGAAPRLRFDGATALEWEGDRSVWARLAGEVDALTAITRRIPTTVQRLGLFIDRRRFRPLLEVATITAATTADRLESLVRELGGPGPDWVLEEITLLRPNYQRSGKADSSWLPLETLPLEAPAALD